MIIEAKSRETYDFSVMMPVFTPFYNVWAKNVYRTQKAFSYDPFTIDASSTSGSPVIIAGNKFFGFVNQVGAHVDFDGLNKLTITLEKGQKLHVNECCDPYSEWLDYSRSIIGDEKKVNEPFWYGLEYCTWVEQSKTSALAATDNYAVFDEKFVYDYMRRVNKMKLPRGKFTIDDGWAVNEKNGYYSGDWDVDTIKFPDMKRLVRDIKSEGFIPGLWFSPFVMTPNCRLAQDHPELLGTVWNASRQWYNIRFLEEDVLREYYRGIFSRYADMGFMKFKLDISYGLKNEMIGLLSLLYDEIKKINPKIEVETHIPDIFATRYADTVRLNDVHAREDGEWRHITAAHYEVCRYSSPDRILNLDHIGTNISLPMASDFLEHWKLLKSFALESGGYPIISLLPDFYADSVRDRVAEDIRTLYNEDGSRRFTPSAPLLQ